MALPERPDEGSVRSKTPKSISLTGRINLIVIVSLAIGLGLVAALFATSLVNARQRLTKEALVREADMLYTSIENFMMVGEAPIVIKFFTEVRRLDTGFILGLFRRNGESAFSDNATIAMVNGNLGQSRFTPRTEPALAIMPPERPYFDAASMAPTQSIFFRWKDGGRTYDRVYRPLLNLPKCTACHGADHTIRGVIDLRTDVTPFLMAQQATIGASTAGFIFMVIALALVIGRFMRSVVVRPVQAIGRVCTAVTEGDFSGRVDVTRSDEVGQLAATVNDMVQGLYERFELTKYVSADTISSITDGQQPKRVTRTLLFSDVRGFTAYTEQHGADAVVSVLNRLIEEQVRIIHGHGGDIDKFVGDEIVAVFSGDGAPMRACLAAGEIRDLAGRASEFDGLVVGVGIATGTVIQGMIGFSRRADFTVIGDPVNVASRLCSVARAGEAMVCDCTFNEMRTLGQTLLVPAITSLRDSPPTRPAPGNSAMSETGSRMTFMGPYRVKLKGKAEEQRVYLLTGADVGQGGPRG
ncbi:MAG: adenylate/guanylate cyclase domain-containing protein [Spirochaetales bacterium]|nr:MAG: adenylate/guanylate cyclase domain-containing protein [Spirochaetales bacterium]